MYKKSWYTELYTAKKVSTRDGIPGTRDEIPGTRDVRYQKRCIPGTRDEMYQKSWYIELYTALSKIFKIQNTNTY